MIISYEQWRVQNSNVAPLVKKLKSSIPEQYIGFYLENTFSEEIEYQKQFPWLGRRSLDIYIPSLCLAIEYDGYHHSSRDISDAKKTSLCRSNGIYLIRVVECTAEQPKSRKHNVVSYYYQKRYQNIDEAINALFKKINKRYGTELKLDVDLERDKEKIVSYIQQKFYKKSAAYVWPETEDYWLEEENGISRFDILATDGRWLWFKCPRCGKTYRRHMRYYTNRMSLVPCDCEFREIECMFNEAIRNYKENGEIVVFDESLSSRRLYDRMADVVDRMWHCGSKEEAELYKKSGFTSPYIDVYLELCKKHELKNKPGNTSDCLDG